MNMKSLFVSLLFVLLCPLANADQIDAYPGGTPSGTIAPPEKRGEPSPDLMPTPPLGPEGHYDPPPSPRRAWWRGGERNYSEVEARLRLYAVVDYDFAGSAYSNANGTLFSPTFNGPSSFSADMNTSPGFSAEVFMARPYSIGFDGGFNYELTRPINDFNSVASSTYYNGTKPTLQFSNVYGNGVFRWWNGYIPLGINYSLPTFTGGVGNGALTNTNFVGDVGFQIGLGYLIGRDFAIEVEDRILHFHATSNSPSTTINWGETYLSGLHVNLKFSFL
jgi:hypothetical protein